MGCGGEKADGWYCCCGCAIFAVDSNPLYDMRPLPPTPRGVNRRGGPIRNETPRQITAPKFHPYAISRGTEGYRTRCMIEYLSPGVLYLDVVVAGGWRQLSFHREFIIVTCVRLFPFFARLDTSYLSPISNLISPPYTQRSLSS